MCWEEIKLDHNIVYPNTEIVEFLMETDEGNMETHWVDRGYDNYAYKKECKYNCMVVVDITDDYNSKKDDHDIVTIENYFNKRLKAVCTAHFIARITTDNGITLEFYVDDVQSAITTLNKMKKDKYKLVNFNCDITDDENWTNVEELFS